MDEDWRADALCAYIGGDLWYPEKGGSAREAKKVCATCPVRLPCLDEALTVGEVHGVWGGLTERERRKINTRDCAHCGSTFVRTRNRAVTCSEPCRKARRRRQQVESERRRKLAA